MCAGRKWCGAFEYILHYIFHLVSFVAGGRHERKRSSEEVIFIENSWKAAMINRYRIFNFNFAINSRCFRIENAAGEAIFRPGINCMCVMEISIGSPMYSRAFFVRTSLPWFGDIGKLFICLRTNARLESGRHSVDSARLIHLAC